MEYFVSNSEVDEIVISIEKQVIKSGQVLTIGAASLAGGGLAAMGAVGATTEKKLEEMYAKKAEVNTEVEKLESAPAVLTKIELTTKNYISIRNTVLILMHYLMGNSALFRSIL